jgi:hypothetical protein
VAHTPISFRHVLCLVPASDPSHGERRLMDCHASSKEAYAQRTNKAFLYGLSFAFNG